MPFDANKIIAAFQTNPQAALRDLQAQGTQMLQSVSADPAQRNLAMGLGAGALAGMFAGRGSKSFLGASAKLGAVAALGGLAFSAWQSYQAKKAGGMPAGSANPMQSEIEAPPQHAGFLPQPDNEAANENHGKAILRAMIAAAQADGRIDAEEKARMFDQLGQISLSGDELDFLSAEMARQHTPEDIGAAAQGNQALAAQIYGASFLAIRVDGDAERDYLARLSRALGLDPALVQEIESHAA